MSWKELEFIFNRAFLFSYGRKKLLFVFPCVLLCGFLFLLCRALALGAGDWMTMSLTFLPVFFCSTLLLAMGIVLTRIYHNEVKGIAFGYRKTLRQSWDLMLGISALSLPLVLAYLLLWTLLGIFFLLKAIPVVGSVLALILSFGPFLLVLGSLLLSLLNLTVLFFVTPEVALKSLTIDLEIGEKIKARLQKNPFTNLVLFFVACLPFIVLGGILLLAALMTGANYITANETGPLLIQGFVILLPFSALLSPAVLFFFNFAAESYVLMRKKANSLQKAE